VLPAAFDDWVPEAAMLIHDANASKESSGADSQ